MEIKSRNVLIGTFALAMILAIFAFAFWLGHVQLDRSVTNFRIIFQGSVSGLSKSGTVQFNGLPVGKVVDLYIAGDDPNKVVALVQIDARTPVKQNSVAKLELEGLTGVAIIQITGGTPDSPPLHPKDGESYAVMYAQPSTLQELSMAAPEALQNAKHLLEQLNVLVRNNQQNVSDILVNLDQVSKALAGSSKDLSQAIKNISDAAGQVNDLSRNADKMLQTNIKDFVTDARETSHSFRQVADNLDRILRVNGPIDRFSNDGLGQMPQLIAQTRALVASLDRIVSRAQDDPARFIIGNRVPEVTAK